MLIYLSPTHALRLLRSVYPEIRDTPVTFVCVTVDRVRMEPALSEALAVCLDHVVDEVLETLAAVSPPPSPQAVP